MSAAQNLTGHYSIVYSPDDDAKDGKGWYADLWWAQHIDAPSFKTRLGAQRWAVKHGGTHEHDTT